MSDSIHRVARMLESIRKILVNLIWILVVVIVLAAIGKLILERQRPEAPPETLTSEAIPAPIPWDDVDAEIVDAVRVAHAAAEELAATELDAWIAGLVERVDADFLDWYFNYWNQQILGLQSLWYASVHTVFEEQPTAAEKITENIQEEFARRVLRPQLAQLELENIMRQVLDRYVSELRTNLAAIPERYDIPRAEWERYLDDISVLTSGTEASREVPLTMKALYVSGAGGAVLLGKYLTTVVGKVGSKVAAASAGKAAAQMAAKTGGKVAAKAGGKLVGPIIGVGIVIWDVWDFNQTRSHNRPILRRTLLDYFAEMRESLLHDADTGVMSAIHEIEAGLVESLRSAQR